MLAVLLITPPRGYNCRMAKNCGLSHSLTHTSNGRFKAKPSCDPVPGFGRGRVKHNTTFSVFDSGDSQ
jgi:hypothetical protein